MEPALGKSMAKVRSKFAEGKTKFKNKHHTEYDDVESVAADIRFTSKDNILYAISLDWPEDGIFRIKTLKSGSKYLSRDIDSVDFLSSPVEINWSQSNEALEIRTNGNKPCRAAYAFKIKFKN